MEINKAEISSQNTILCYIITIYIMFCLDWYITNIAKFAETFLHFCFWDSREQATNI